MTHAPDTPPAPKGKAPSKVWLYLPFILFGLICAAYTGYWFVVKGKLAEGVNQFIAQQREDGVELTYTAKRLHGFPYRFTLTVDDLTFANPEAGFDWRGETLQINMQPWNFSQAIIRSSGRNELTLGNGQSVTALIGKKSALSLNWSDKGLEDIGLTLDTADIVLAAGDIALKNFKASLVNVQIGHPSKRLLVDWDGVTLAQSLIAGTDLEFLGTELQASRLRVEGQGFGLFGEAEDRKFEIAQLLLNWGPVKLGSKGKFDITDQGYPDGTLYLRLDESDALLKILKEDTQLGSEAIGFVGGIGLATKNSGFYVVPVRNGAITYPGLSAQVFPGIAPDLTLSPILPPNAE